MNELWKKLSVPSKFKTDSKNNYRMKGKQQSFGVVRIAINNLIANNMKNACL